MIKEVLAVVLIILIGIVGYLTYFVFVNFYSTPAEFKPAYSYDTLGSFNSSAQQFYPNMRFETTNISYSFVDGCPPDTKNKMRQAFAYLENVSTKLSFVETGSGDIEIACGEEFKDASEGYFVAGEGGPRTIVNGTLFNIILNGQIFLYSSEACSFNIELHELLHVFGFSHSPDRRSVLYNVTSCNQILTRDVLDKIIELYSFESLPDLYFSDASAVKRGNYLNLNFTIKNQGLSYANNVTVEVTADGDKESFGLEGIGVGEGRVFSGQNIRVPLKTSSIELEIKNGRELFQDNNKLTLNLAIGNSGS